MKLRFSKLRILIFTFFLAAITAGVLALKTVQALRPAPETFRFITEDIRKPRLADRNGTPLTITHVNTWNVHDYEALHDIPEFLRLAFVVAEDKRFFEHRGVDRIAQVHAMWQNMLAFRVVRGASTITEQVVRMIHPRPRTVWSRWLEGFEAIRLEERFSKAAILEFYLNQVPYAANRRGVVQAARYYFNRDPDTLNHREMLALAALVRAPGRMDLRADPEAANGPIHRLAERLAKAGNLTETQHAMIAEQGLGVSSPKPLAEAYHFAGHVLRDPGRPKDASRLRTTLDADLQIAVRRILDERIGALSKKRVKNGAAIVVDHMANEILVWAVAGGGDENSPGGLIDAVTVPRQPGSAMKPFLYALALESGWTAATMIDDSPLAEPVGAGLHSYKNYSRQFYGRLPLRQALGNSLNIPAVRTIRFVGVDAYFGILRELGFDSLSKGPKHYGDGLALGNGEVTLFELARAYAALARGGEFSPPAILSDYPARSDSRRVFSEEVCSLVANILSDPEARRLEFGSGNLLRFPVQTAVKTGTSNDYRDAWAMGFNYRYTAGIWMGNLDGTPTDGLTGSTGPALCLRSIFAEVNRFRETRPLRLSPKLVKTEFCHESGQGRVCRTEWFVPGTEPEIVQETKVADPIRFRQPTDGLRLATDPRIPDDREIFAFILSGVSGDDTVEWTVDGQRIAETQGGRYLWPVKKGTHHVRAKVFSATKGEIAETGRIGFVVK